MRHLKQLIVAMVAVLAVGGVLAGVAQAAPKLSGTIPQKIEGSGNEGHLRGVGGETITCESNKAPGEITTSTLIFVHITWKGCKSGAGAKCKTAGNSAGEILIEIVANLVLRGSVFPLYWWEFLEVKITIVCGVLDIPVKGNVLLASSLKEGVATSSSTVTGKETSEHKQEVTSCEEPAEFCTENPIELLSEFVEGKPESSALVQEDTITSESPVTAEG